MSILSRPPLRFGRSLVGEGYPCLIVGRRSQESWWTWGPQELRDQVSVIDQHQLRNCDRLHSKGYSCIKNIEKSNLEIVAAELRRGHSLWVDVRSLIWSDRNRWVHRITLTSRSPVIFLEGIRNCSLSHIENWELPLIAAKGIWAETIAEARAAVALGASVVVCDWDLDEDQVDDLQMHERLICTPVFQHHRMRGVENFRKELAIK